MHVDVLSILSLFSAAPFVVIAAILCLYLIRRVPWVRSTRSGRRLFGMQPSAVGLGMAFLFLGVISPLSLLSPLAFVYVGRTPDAPALPSRFQRPPPFPRA